MRSFVSVELELGLAGMNCLPSGDLFHVVKQGDRKSVV